ncbi:MAG: SH3 domain-containing protein [Deltaproteobacteria bacterium]|nr:SH3 domain-containing protein [Deltaproteobacteria bacterium]
MKTPLLLLLVTALLLPSLGSATPQSDGCVTQYNEGAYADAAACFQGLEAEGHLTGDLLYDQGNAWYRAGELGQSILAWRRAMLLMPRDGDLIANLDAAQERTRDEIPTPRARGFVLGALLLPVDRMSASELLLLGALGWALLFGVGAVRLRREFPGAAGLMALGALCAVLGLGGWLFTTWEEANHPVAVVLLDEVTVRSGRDLGSRDLLVLHEGAQVIVAEADAEWVQVGIVDGPRGWVPAESVGVVELSSADRETR